MNAPKNWDRNSVSIIFEYILRAAAWTLEWPKRIQQKSVGVAKGQTNHIQYIIQCCSRKERKMRLESTKFVHRKFLCSHPTCGTRSIWWRNLHRKQKMLFFCLCGPISFFFMAMIHLHLKLFWIQYDYT